MAGIKNNILPQIGIICGSGLNNIADKLEQPIILPFDKLPGFPLPSVNGHKGNVIFGWLGGKYCICLQGRFHPYEHNMDMALCTMPVRLMAMMGIKTLIASNAAGGINSNLNIGDLMIIKDHIFMPGLMGFSPLVGLKDKRFGNRFVSMQNAYDQKLRKKALILAENIGISAKEGVYVMNAGPHYETVAECSLAARLGGDALGMSTCHEIMVARQLGIRCFAFSLITNCSSLDLNNPLDVCHSDVLEIGIKVGEKTSEWITQLIKTLDEEEEIIKIKD